jgi:error-prone DNA polymerase
MPARYVPLWCKSHFSFLDGASHPEELVETCVRQGIESLALTDRDGVHGAVRAHVKARETGCHLIVGSEVTLDDGSTIVLLAQDRAGYGHLCQLITLGRRRSPKGESHVSWDEVAAHATGLLALWGGDRSLITREAEPDSVAHLLSEAFGDRLYAMVARHRRPEEVAEERRLRERSARYGLPRVAAVEVLYHHSARRRLQDVLTAIRHSVPLATAGRRLKPNAEHDLKSPYVFSTLFADDPAAVAATLDVAGRCHFHFDEVRYRYPSEHLPAGLTSAQWLRQLTFDGAQGRYRGEPPEAVRTQLEKELALIDELDYCGYFLTMWEIVRFCNERAILCQGRGSAANSAVCYCLGVTAVDPVRMNLLFERFLSKERAEPPDIDLDIAHERREEVIQHVYSKYGREHAAMVANLIRYRPRSAARDVGKALGLSETTLARLAKLLPHYYGDVTPTILAQAGLDPESPASVQLLELASELQGFPRHLSIHPGGFLLGHEPVSTLVPIENGTMKDRTVIQWDKEDVEALGLFKVDLLGLGALSHLDRCFKLLQKHRGVELSMASIPAEDPATFAMSTAADTVGVFQLESRAQMSMLPRLKPVNFYDLVVEISLVRPGPISGGMVHPYLARRRGDEPIVYPHESLVPILKKTMGVPLFQEQVMKLAIVAADYTPGEADQLRRDMAAWRRSGRIEQHHEKLVTRMRAKGIEVEFAERVFEQIRGFGEYGFPESHAASFALISYATAWLKCHYPAEFACGLLNAQPMGFYSPSTIVEDAKRHAVEVRRIDVCTSEWDCTLEPKNAEAFALRLGLREVRGLGATDGADLLAARQAAPFADLADVVRRTHIDRGGLEALAEAGAFESLGVDRRTALWEIKRLVRERGQTLAIEAHETLPLFRPLDAGDGIHWDYRATAMSPSGHPLQIVRDELRRRGCPDALGVAQLPHGSHARYVGAVICRQRPGTAKGVVFMTLEDETGLVNVLLWPKVYEKYALVVRTNAILGIAGRIESQEGVIHLVGQRVWAPRFRRAPPEQASRDFH